MEYRDNYPNGWKDGYSSADDPDRSRNDAAFESARRDAMIETEKNELKDARRLEIEKEKERQQAKEAAEQTRREVQQQQLQKKINNNLGLRDDAVKIIVEQKRLAYDKHNFLKKAVLKIQGRTFEQMRFKIISDAEKRVDKMSNEEVRNFVEANEGRRR